MYGNVLKLYRSQVLKKFGLVIVQLIEELEIALIVLLVVLRVAVPPILCVM